MSPGHLDLLLRRLAGVTGIRVAGAGATFIFSLLVARTLDAEDAGRVYWAIAATSLLAVIARGGLDKGFMRSAAIISSSQSDTAAAAVVTRRFIPYVSTAAVTLTLTLLGYAAWIDSTLGWTQNFVALAIVSTAIVGSSISVLAGSAAIGAGLSVRGTLLAAPAAAIVSLGIAVAVLLLTEIRSLTLFCSAYACGWTGSAIAAFFLQQRYYPALERTATPQGASETGWFALVGVANTLEQWAPTLISGSMLSPSAAADFALCSRLVAVIQLIMVSATAAYAHMYATAHSRELDILVGKAVRSLALVGIPLIAALAIFAPQVLGIFGPEFVRADNLLRIMLIGQAVNIGAGTFSVVLMMRGHVSVVAKAFCSASIVQVALALYGAQQGREEFIAITCVITVAIHSSWCLWAYLRMIRKKAGSKEDL
jgi:Membrane protein involved in the export of O-antigen and teichoic acid